MRPLGTMAMLLVVGAASVAGCSWSRLDESTSLPSSTVAEEMRSVPTVPPTTVEASSGSTAETDASGTGLESIDQAASVDPDATVAPPTTELVGDPQPNPDSNDTLPPLPEGTPTIAACAALASLGAVDVVARVAGADAVAETAGAVESCRFTAGNVVAEVHFVPEGQIESDWFGRDGIEPVGQVSGDAVGLEGFLTPDGAGGDGYTVALISRRQGAIVAVTGTADAKLLAGELAVLANESV